ncbi:MAG TPA: SPOR domain-containing protein [Marinobacter sp.]|nr:SPOR domain-containing protein [Marinobacter sp.]
MDGLKQRIIGALVLISLAVIFVPMIFDEPHSERQSTPITIPEEPPFPEVDMPDAPRQVSPPVASDRPSANPGYRIVEEPAEPASPVAAGPEPLLPVESEPAPEPAPVASTSPAEPQARPQPEQAQPEEFAKTLEGAWVVQLGSFGNADNARRLRDRVLEMNYGAHLQQVSRGDSELIRVFSGPFVSEAEANKAKTALDKEFNLNALVTRGSK